MRTFYKWVEDQQNQSDQPNPDENQAGMGQADTSASDEVKRTNLQPQIGTDKIAKNSADIDSLMAIDSKIQHFDSDIKDVLRDDSESAHQLKGLWSDLRSRWKEFKQKKENSVDNGDYGLGSEGGDSGYRKQMYDHPNATPPQDEVPPGPGTLGN